MNVKPNDSTAKFGSVIKMVSPLCSRHVQHNFRLWSKQAISYCVTVCI